MSGLFKYWRIGVYGFVLIAALFLAYASTMDDNGPKSRAEGTPLIVFITSTNDVRLSQPDHGDSVSVPLDALEETIRGHAVLDYKRPVLLITHPDADSGMIVEALDAARRAGAPKFIVQENIVE